MLSRTDGTRVTTQDLHRFCVEAMKNVGVSTEHANITADALVMTDTWGVFTHGTKLLHGYEQRLRLGGLRTDVEPRIERESANTAGNHFTARTRWQCSLSRQIFALRQFAPV